jgi:chromosome condensin MukBEF MukE localization factor
MSKLNVKSHVQRKLAESEIKELAALIGQYVAFSPGATDNELNNGILSLSELYDEVLSLRYSAR